MKPIAKTTVACCAPFLTWTLLLTFLPASAGAYALRTALTAAVAIIAWAFCRDGGAACAPRTRPAASLSRDALWGVAAGLLVFAFWVAPEQCEWYRIWCVTPIGRVAEAAEASPYDPAICGWTLTLVKLVGSAFVIAPVEELFFRKFLYRWIQMKRSGWTQVPPDRFNLGAFCWTVALFACEHNRFAVAALCGIVYGLVSIRRSLACAIIAHVTTNLVLAIYVIRLNLWNFW